MNHVKIHHQAILIFDNVEVLGLRVVPNYEISNCPNPDILVVPGGVGTRTQMNNQKFIWSMISRF